MYAAEGCIEADGGKIACCAVMGRRPGRVSIQTTVLAKSLHTKAAKTTYASEGRIDADGGKVALCPVIRMPSGRARV